jgi:hypothetical protein
MHRPGYVQGGQEVGRDYLLLRIHVRRIRSDIHANMFIFQTETAISISFNCIFI